MSGHRARSARALTPVCAAKRRIATLVPSRELTTVAAMAEQPAPVDDHALADAASAVDWLHGQPYPGWAQARASECPVVADEHGLLGSGTSYSVLRYKDAETVLRDADTFSSSINGEHIGQFMGDLILAMNGNEHRTYRNLVAKAFHASQLERWDETLVKPTDGCALPRQGSRRLGQADLVASVTSVYPVQVMSGIAGVPLKEHAAQFSVGRADQHGPAVFRSRHGCVAGDGRLPASAGRGTRARMPNGDFLSDLVHEEVDGERLTDSKIYGFLRLLLPTGAETTFRVMGNCLYALLSHPGETSRASTPIVPCCPTVIEETLRWETSVTQVSGGYRDPRRRGSRAARCRGRFAGWRDHRVGEPRDESRVGRRRGVEARSPGSAPPHVRHRTPPVPGHAPGPAGVAGRPRPDPRPLAQLRFDPAGRERGDRRRSFLSEVPVRSRCCSPRG